MSITASFRLSNRHSFRCDVAHKVSQRRRSDVIIPWDFVKVKQSCAPRDRAQGHREDAQQIQDGAALDLEKRSRSMVKRKRENTTF